MGEREGDHLHLLNWVTCLLRSLGSLASPKIVRLGVVAGGGGWGGWLYVVGDGGRTTCGMVRLVKRPLKIDQVGLQTTTGGNSFSTPGFFSHLAELKKKNLLAS